MHMNVYAAVFLIQRNDVYHVIKRSTDYIRLSIDPTANIHYPAIARAVIKKYTNIIGATIPPYEEVHALKLGSRSFVGEIDMDNNHPGTKYSRFITMQIAISNQLSNLDTIIKYNLSGEFNDPIHFGQYWRDVTNLIGEEI